MGVSQYKVYKCDNCEKEKEIRDDTPRDDYPTGWLTISIYIYKQGIGTIKYYKLVCSPKCLKEITKKFQRLPSKELQIKQL